MSSLPKATIERLQRLPGLRGTWHGELRTLSHPDPQNPHGRAIEQAYVLWMDISQPAIRVMEPVLEGAGYEAVVQALLRAIEHPPEHQTPGRPQSVMVRDRELHFFLRGALQDLDIKVGCKQRLPLVDEVFDLFVAQQTRSVVQRIWDSVHVKRLTSALTELWDYPLWDEFAEVEVLELLFELDEPQHFYVSVLGMAGLERGLLLYRSLDSLKRFREAVNNPGNRSNLEVMEAAFLQQDCLFLNFEDLEGDPPSSNMPVFQGFRQSFIPDLGSIHPLEGLRYILSDQELAVMIVAVEALTRFRKNHETVLAEADHFPALESQIVIPNPINHAPKTKPQKIAVTVRTLPEVCDELIGQPDELDQSDISPSNLLGIDSEEPEFDQLQQLLLGLMRANGSPNLDAFSSDRGSMQLLQQMMGNLGQKQPKLASKNAGSPQAFKLDIESEWIPEGALFYLQYSLTELGHQMIPLSMRMPLVDHPFPQPPKSGFGNGAKNQKSTTRGTAKKPKSQPSATADDAHHVPVLCLQTSQPKAKTLIREWFENDRPIAVGIVTGRDFAYESSYDLFVLCTARGRLLSLDIFWHDEPDELTRLNRWRERAAAAGDRCSVALLKGVTGRNRGQLVLTDLIQLWDIHVLQTDQLTRLAFQIHKGDRA
jgi:hypothetical protein